MLRVIHFLPISNGRKVGMFGLKMNRQWPKIVLRVRRTSIASCRFWLKEMISKCLWFNGQCGVDSYSNLVSSGVGMNVDSKSIMHIQNHIRNRTVLSAASLVFALAGGLPNEVSAGELKQAKVTQVIQDVQVLPSNASPRPAAVNDDVHQGTAVQTGVQSRSELTFKDQTITRLGEKTIFSVGQGARTIDLGSGQFLLYVPKKSSGTKVKMGTVTAAITG